MKTMLLVFLISFLLSSNSVEGIQATGIQEAKCMKTKCTVSVLNKELRTMKGKDKLLKVLSWNVGRLSARRICLYISRMDVEVIGLQRLIPREYHKLTKTCMKNFNVSGVPDNLHLRRTISPIFFKTKSNGNTITAVASGSYSTPPVTWTRLNFRPPNSRNRRNVLGQNLLNLLTGKRAMRKYSRAIRRRHRKQMLFVNIDLYDDDKHKDITIKKQLSRVYYKVMRRRRHRAILFGTVGFEKSAKVLNDYMRRRRRGSEVYVSLFRKAMATSDRRKPNIINQIWKTNASSKGFRTVLSAIVHTNTRNKPTFSVFHA